MVVGAGEPRARERLRHQDRRRAVAAADVGDTGAALELLDDAVERGQPRRDEVGVVAGAEEPLAAVVHVVDVLVPAEPVAGARGLGDLRRVDHRAERELEEARQVRRALRVGERDGLLGGERVAAGLGVVADVVARRLGVAPLAHVALGGAGPLRQLGRRQRPALGERAVEAELVAHHDERGVERRADLVDRAEHELHELVAVDLDGVVQGGHGRDRMSGPPSLASGAPLVFGAAGPGGSVGPCSWAASGEREAIGRALAAARSGESTVLALVGEPGIGKTALLDHAAGAAVRMRVLRARGIESEAQIPFASLLELLRPALALLERAPAAAGRGARGRRSRCARRPRRSASRSAPRRSGLLAALAEEQPVAVLVDDAQWLDHSSAQALLFAARRLVADPIAVLLAVRAGEPSLLDGADLPVLPIAGLTPAATAELLDGARPGGGGAAAPGDGRQPARAARAARPGGRAAHRRARRCWSPPGSRRPTPRGWTGSAPPRAPPSSSPPRATAATWRCWSVRRPRSTSTWRRSPRRSSAGSSRSAAAPSPSPTRWPAPRSTRPRRPRRGAPPTARSPPRCPTATSTGARGTSRRRRSGTDEAASAALEHAGDRARERSAYGDAAAAFERGARLTADAEHRARLLCDAAETAWLAGLADRAVALLDEARAATADAALCRPHRPAGRPDRGPPRPGDARARDPHRHGGAGRAGAAVAMLTEAAGACFYAGEPVEMLAMAERAAALAETGVSPRARFLAGASLGMAQMLGGDAAAGTRSIHAAIALAEEDPALRDDLELLPWLAIGPIFLREAGAGRSLLDHALDAARDARGGRRAAARAQPDRARPGHHRSLGARRRPPTARRSSSRARAGSRPSSCFGLAGLAWLQARRGREQECRALAAEARRSAGRWGRGCRCCGRPTRWRSSSSPSASPSAPSSTSRGCGAPARLRHHATSTSRPPPSSSTRYCGSGGATRRRRPSPRCSPPRRPRASRGRSPARCAARGLVADDSELAAPFEARARAARAHARRVRGRRARGSPTASACGAHARAASAPASSCAPRWRRSSASTPRPGRTAPAPSSRRPARRCAGATRARSTS